MHRGSDPGVQQRPEPIGAVLPLPAATAPAVLFIPSDITKKTPGGAGGKMVGGIIPGYARGCLIVVTR
jgi:hypothetical protein